MQLTIQDDFDLAKIADSGQCFRVWAEAGGYRFISGGRSLHIAPAAQGTFHLDCTQEAWDTYWKRYFDMGRDYAALRRAIPSEDAPLKRMAECGAGLRILRQEPWETLVSFIISQRKSIPAIRGSVEKLCALCGAPFGDGALRFAFPTPEALLRAQDDALAACALGYRLPYLRDAARRVGSGELDLEGIAALPDEALRESLKSVYGVGDKVANCVALFAYARMDCAPVDVWIQRVIEREYGGQSPFARYGQGAGVYQQYMFYYAQTQKKGLQQNG